MDLVERDHTDRRARPCLSAEDPLLKHFLVEQKMALLQMQRSLQETQDESDSCLLLALDGVNSRVWDLVLGV